MKQIGNCYAARTPSPLEKGGMRQFSRLVVALIFILFSLNSCEEIGPDIDLTSDTTADTTYIAPQVETPQIKNVLLEEFTGVRCVNCPQGHELLDNLQNQHGERFIAASNHSELLAEPYDGDQNLQVPEAQALEDLLGPALGKPSGTVDRKQYSGETSLMLFTQKWANYVNQQMSLTTPVNIHIETDLNSNSRRLEVVVTLHHTVEDTQDTKLTVLLLEDSIITQQLDHGGVVQGYVQNRVLRKALTSTNGLTLSTPKEAGRVIVKSFEVENLPSIWNLDKLQVVALVHRSDGVMDVLHVVRKGVE